MTDATLTHGSDADLIELLALVTTALRDIYLGYPASEIDAGDGSGLDALLRRLITELRGRGIDDEGGWDCDVTQEVPVAVDRSPGTGRLAAVFPRDDAGDCSHRG